MNKHIFRSYIDNITQYYGIPEEKIFSGTKHYELVEPRRLFFYLCNKKGIPVVTIQKFLEGIGYKVEHSTIIRGIQKITQTIESNEEYQKVLARLEVITANV